MLRIAAVILVLFAARASAEDAGKFVGSAGCKSSSCHGGAGERRSQFITWSQKDFHTRAYTILLDARSARIGESLRIENVQTSSRCTVCHSPLQSVGADRLAAAARPDEGVSCENCHGAAGPWLRGHTRPDWTYATRVSAGMRDLRNLYLRANACVACHQNVDADILQAGHPELVFELDSQSTNEPRHWREDDSAIGPRSWLIGQAVALREIIWAANSASGQDRDRLVAQASALSWLLDKAGLGEGVTSLSSFPGIQMQADAIARRAVDWNPTKEALISVLQKLAASDAEFQNAQKGREALFYQALRLTLALDRIATGLNLSSKIDKELNALRSDVQRHYDFDVALFAQHLQALRAKL